jgi:RNA polymerase sigma-70 factor (ECF subfamily)
MTMTDQNILQLLFARAEGAIEALARQFGQRLYAIAMNILSSPRDAEECVNDTYLALWNAIPPEKPDPLCAYTYRVGRNIALKRLRSNTAQMRNSAYEVSLDELSGCIAGHTLEETVDARELGRAIDAFLDTLSPDSRIMFLRRYWFGDSVKEIAVLLSMKENAVSVRLSRTREKLKAYLTEEGFYCE